MSAAADGCCTGCENPVVTEIPGAPGEDGAAGAAGSDGTNAYTFTTASFVVPAKTSTVTVSVGSSAWMAIGQNVFISGLSPVGYFEVVSFPSALSVVLEYLDYSQNTASGQTIIAGAQVSPAGTQYSLSAALPTAFTDNSTGVASDTIALGAGVQMFYFPHTFIGGTSAVEPVTQLTIPFAFEILSWYAITSVLLVGAAGSRVANLEIDATDVGTVVSTCTIPIANAAVGTVTAATAVSGANTGTAGQTLSIEIAAGGTQFTAGVVTFVIVVRNRDTTNAIASLADHVNDLIASLT